MSSGRFCHSSGPQIENKRKQKDKQILWSCQRTKKAMEPEDDGDSNSSWCTCDNPQRIEMETRDTGELEIKERIESTQTTALLRLTRILKRVLETWGTLLQIY